MEIQEKKKLTRVGDLDVEIHETMNAPTLPPAVLDGLIWRSRNQEAGMHRANYYLKHLHIDEDGTFPKTLKWCGGATLSGRAWQFADSSTPRRGSSSRSSTGTPSKENNGAQNVPTTYPEMLQFNMAVMEFDDRRSLPGGGHAPRQPLPQAVIHGRLRELYMYV